MKINEVNIPKNNENGLSEIKMIKLENVVCIAGQNGSGKSRLIDAIKNELLIKPKKSALQKFESELLLLEKRKNDNNTNIKSHQTIIHQLETANEELNKLEIAQSKTYIPRWEQDNISVDLEIKSIKESQSYTKLKTDNIYESYNFIDFIPSSDILIDHNSINVNEQKTFANELENNSLLNFNSFNRKVFSLINQIQDRYIKSTHPETKLEDIDKAKIDFQYKNLQKYIKEFLNTDLKFTDSPQLFDLALEKAKLSAGQSILLQFCVVLSLQEGKLEDLIIFMDEPENHLHPKALLDVINKIINAIPNGQLWIATHSVHLLSHFEPERIWYMDEGKISHYGKSSLKVLESLIGDDERIEKMLNFMSLPAYLATNKYAYECLFVPETVVTNKDDPQIKQIMQAISQGSQYNVLDFGAGQGRLLSSINEICQEKNQNIEDIINYYACDIEENEYCKKIFEDIFGNRTNYIITDEAHPNKLKEAYENRFDIVLMCNVLHEINPACWLDVFSIIHSILKENATLIIIEDHLIPYGEKAYDNGFLVFDEDEFKMLFTLDSYKVDSQKEGRLKAHFFEKDFLTNVSETTIHSALSSHLSNSIRHIKELRKKTKPDFKDGQLHGFWTQQFLNCNLMLKDMKVNN